MLNPARATIIPKALSGGDELVVISRAEYERLRAQEADEVVPPIVFRRVPRSELSKETLKKFREARRTPLSKMLNI